MAGYCWEYQNGVKFPKFDEQVLLCHNNRTAWLELSNTEFLVNDSYGSAVVKAFIGAVKGPNGWQEVNPATIPGKGTTRESLTSNFSNTNRILDFQRAIIRQWREFKGSKASNYAKGTTFGKSLTSASFVAKALKTGYDAIGQPMPAYRGLKLGNWTVADLLQYAQMRAPALKDPPLIGFKTYTPNPAYDQSSYKKDPPASADGRKIPYIASQRAKGHSGHFAYAAELKNVPFDRVIAYGFRGDTRAPGQIKGAGGFNPNYTRTDHIANHQNQPKNAQWWQGELGALNLKEFIANQEFRGFLSTSKSIAIAKNFATGYTDPPAKDGWVYACFVEGGFDLPPLGTHSWVIYAEQEISMPGMLDWEDVVACRRVKKDGTFDGPIYMKPELEAEDNLAGKQIWDLLSGKGQG